MVTNNIKKLEYHANCYHQWASDKPCNDYLQLGRVSLNEEDNWNRCYNDGACSHPLRIFCAVLLFLEPSSAGSYP